MPRKVGHDFHSPKQRMRQCLDCPAMIPTYANKKRCAACADLRGERLKNERKKRAHARKRANVG